MGNNKHKKIRRKIKFIPLDNGTYLVNIIIKDIPRYPQNIHDDGGDYAYEWYYNGFYGDTDFLYINEFYYNGMQIYISVNIKNPEIAWHCGMKCFNNNTKIYFHPSWESFQICTDIPYNDITKTHTYEDDDIEIICSINGIYYNIFQQTIEKKVHRKIVHRTQYVKKIMHSFEIPSICTICTKTMTPKISIKQCLQYKVILDITCDKCQNSMQQSVKIINDFYMLDAFNNYCIYRDIMSLNCNIQNNEKCILFRNEHRKTSCNIKVYHFLKEKHRSKYGSIIYQYSSLKKPNEYNPEIMCDKILNAQSQAEIVKISYNVKDELNLENRNWINKELDIDKVHIFDRFLKCVEYHHDLEYYRIHFKDLNNMYTIDTADVIYCTKCNKFYMDNTQYEYIRQCKVLPHFKINLSEMSYGSFKKYSKLALYGYNAKSITPIYQRQHLLYTIIINNLMSKGEVISHLQGLIALGENNPLKQDAIKRYEEDIMFIHDQFPGREV